MLYNVPPSLAIKHSAKGTTWKDHKYISKETKNGKTKYTYAFMGNKTTAQKEQYVDDLYETLQKDKKQVETMKEAGLDPYKAQLKVGYTERLYSNAREDYYKTPKNQINNIREELKYQGKNFVNGVKDVGDNIKEKADKGKQWLKSILPSNDLTVTNRTHVSVGGKTFTTESSYTTSKKKKK